jgi:hypothetical protein
VAWRELNLDAGFDVVNALGDIYCVVGDSLQVMCDK